jgi:hypothetical protein
MQNVIRTSAAVIVGVLCATSPAGAGAAVGFNAPARTAQVGPPPFLPWAPAAPLPAPPGDLPVVPSEEPFDPTAASGTLAQLLAALQDGMDRLWQWLDVVRQAAGGALTQIVTPLPLPAPVIDPLTMITQIAELPRQWNTIAAAMGAKAAGRSASDPVTVQHAEDITSSPDLSHEAASIAAADQEMASGVVEHEVAAGATASVARAAVNDEALPAAAAAAAATGDELVSDAASIPSSRAGIEMLIAGMGAGLRHQAALTTALADRITGLLQQNAQLSGQIGALASTVSVLTARSLERDRAELNGRLGAADAGQGTVDMFAQLLRSAADTNGEIALDPLY